LAPLLAFVLAFTVLRSLALMELPLLEFAVNELDLPTMVMLEPLDDSLVISLALASNFHSASAA